MNRVMKRDKKTRIKETQWKHELDLLRDKIRPMVLQAGMPDIHAQDLQNALCEFDKYERVRLGEGRPRSLYNGVQDSIRFPRS